MIRMVNSFHTIHSYCFCEIILQKGSVPGVTISTTDEASLKIKYSIEDGVLIFSGNNLVASDSDFEYPVVYVTYTELKGVTLYGYSKLKTKEPIDEKSFGVVLYGSGDVDIAVEGIRLDFTIMRAGKIKVSGFANRLLVRVLRDGEFDGSLLEVEDAEVTIQRSGFVSVWAECELNAQVNLNGTLIYKGKPSIEELFIAKGSMVMPFEWFKHRKQALK